ncbi:acyl-CoA dehydrogenase family protein [Paenibacillus solisilvae]|uniref:Acyl-CoA dehydrogenase family protein n=1 Tax=Paenibacillus solisilvae TaxID=2486751 RepID=A0ABW0VUM1_9BACL
MRLQFTEEQELLRRRVREFAAGSVASAVADMEEKDAFPRELLKAMGQEGLMGLSIPKEYRGAGADIASYIIAIEEIAKVSAAVGVILSVHLSVASLPIVHHGTKEQKSRFLPKLATGELLGAFALTESHAGSDAASIRTSAIRSGDEYILNGSKMFITSAGEAGVYIVFAVVKSEGSIDGITAFIVEKNTPGLRVGKKEKKMGLHGSNTCELIFENMRVPAAQRLGQEGQGFMIAKSALTGGRIGIGAQALGIAKAALAEAERWEIERQSRARPRTPLRDPSLIELAAQVEAAHLLVYRAAYLYQNGLPCKKEASMAKLFASDTAMTVTSRVLQRLGLHGLQDEHPVERYFRDAKVTQIYEGTNEIHRIVISNELLKR